MRTIFVSIILLLFVSGCAGPKPGTYNGSQTPSTAEVDYNKLGMKLLAENLEVPWDIAFLPNGEFLITERMGTIRKIGKSNEVIASINDTEPVGEGGLLGRSEERL